MRVREEQNTAREQFRRQSKKIRRWQILILPLLAALAAPLLCFLWFAFVPPAEQAKPPLALALTAPAVTVRVGGDIMLAGAMADKSAAYGLDFPFRKVKDFLSGADFSFAMLDTPIADQGSPLPGKPLTLSAPPEAVESLALSGLDMVGLASNNMMDYDAPALLQTVELLSGAGLGFMGAGKDAAEAAKPYTLAENNLRVAFLNYCENAQIYYSTQYPRPLAAGEGQAGVANLEEEAMLTAISEARRNHDIVILNLYWGDEESYLPRDSQRQTAHRLIEAGADVIIGFGTHCLQGVEIYDNGLIVYSLGNLVNAPGGSRLSSEAMLLELQLTSLGWRSARLYPLLLSDEGQPALAEGRSAADIRERMRSISAGMGATFTIEGEALRISK